jgi:hypothetical protein
VPLVEPAESTFSDQLERWLRSDEPKTFGGMTDVFGERGFAVLVLLLMSIPAVPLPTGGVTHLFEAVAILIGLEMVLGRATLWLPKRLRGRELGSLLTDKALPFIMKRVRWFEARSRQRGAFLFRQRWFIRLLGVVVAALAVAAALAPPFSGLDTLPALGAVVVALSIVLKDAVVLAVGLLIGTGGVVLILTVGAALARLLRGLF